MELGLDRPTWARQFAPRRDCQDARDEVLAIESMTKVSGREIQTGSWRSWYDGVTTASSTEFDIDHMVPLARRRGNETLERNHTGALRK